MPILFDVPAFKPRFGAPLFLALSALACSAGSTPSSGSGGASSSQGGAGNGGTSSGGASNGGTGNGGASTGNGGTSSGGASASSGGTGNGGSSGGANAGNGGTGSGGASAGASTGGATTTNGGGTQTQGGSNSGGSAGTAGSASSGGSGGATSGSGCSASGLIFCDDFEKGTAGSAPPSPWTIALNGMGTVVVDATTAAHSGSKSVHVSSKGGYQTFFALTGSPVFPAANGALYMRLYIRLDAPMTGGHNTYYKAGAAGATSSEHETRVGVMNAMLMINQPAGDRGFLSNQNYYSDGNKPGVVFPEKTWTCVEAFFDPPHSTFDIWVNGKEVPDLHRTDWQQDALGVFHFGFEKYAGPDADIWYDDIAVSAAPIGCQ
ncbi:MAG: hypothetical protein QM756_03775 [Polyangiaceae bacterium]